jgi:nucleotide-binding universal stress UspA family protein
MFKRILLPTDGTEFCQRAIAHGVGLAKAMGASVVGVTVLQQLHIITPKVLIPANISAMIKEQTAKIAAENLAAVEAAAKAAGVPCELVRETDDQPWEAIIRTADGKGCDLIVMASHGRRGVSAIMLGSETQKVLTHSKVPVLVVR